MKYKTVKSDFVSEDFFNYYKNIGKINKNLFYKITLEFNEAITDKMIDNNFVFSMPYKLGMIGIIKKKPKLIVLKNKIVGNIRKDFGASRKLWKQQYPDLTMQEIYKIKNKKYIYYTNEHTDGYIYKFKWLKETASFKNSNIYKFNICIKKARKLAQILKNNTLNIDYYGN